MQAGSLNPDRIYQCTTVPCTPTGMPGVWILAFRRLLAARDI